MSNKKTKEEWLFELFDEGKKPKEVSELTTYALKTCERYYTSWRRKNDAPKVSVSKNNEAYLKAIKLFQKDIPRKEICKILGRSSSSVCGYYQRWINDGGKLNNATKEHQESAEEPKTILTLIQTENKQNTQEDIYPEEIETHEEEEEDKSYLKSYYVGDIVFVNKNDMLPENDNGVLNANRPAVVVKTSTATAYSVIVIYITKHIKRLDLTKNIKLTTPSLKYESMLVCDQIQTVSKKYINKVGELNKEDKIAIKKALIETFDLNRDVRSVQVRSFSTELANYEIDEKGDVLVKIGNEMIILSSSKLRTLGEEFIYIKENIL